jgi:hypothetical protein
MRFFVFDNRYAVGKGGTRQSNNYKKVAPSQGRYTEGMCAKYCIKQRTKEGREKEQFKEEWTQWKSYV